MKKTGAEKQLHLVEIYTSMGEDIKLVWVMASSRRDIVDQLVAHIPDFFCIINTTVHVKPFHLVSFKHTPLDLT